MKKCYNGFQQFVDESLEGILMAYPSFYRMGNGDRRAILHPTEKRKVRIVTGGGYGHLPVFWDMWERGCAMLLRWEMYLRLHPVKRS